MVLVAGMVLAAVAAHVLTVWVALLASTLLGCGYGMAMIVGLLEVQRIAGPDDLAGLTAVFYGVTYLGFGVPAVLAWISESWPAITYPVMFGFGAVAAMMSLIVALLGHRRHGAPVVEPGTAAMAGSAGGAARTR